MARKTVSTWYLGSLENEPDLKYYWKGTEDEYKQAVRLRGRGHTQAIPDARVGGPASTGPGPGPQGHSSAYLRAFLAHCTNNKSLATGGPIPLDFISFHVKGRRECCRRSRADGSRPRTEQCCRWVRHRAPVSPVPKASHHLERSGSRGLRGLLCASLSTQRLS